MFDNPGRITVGLPAKQDGFGGQPRSEGNPRVGRNSEFRCVNPLPLMPLPASARHRGAPTRYTVEPSIDVAMQLASFAGGGGYCRARAPPASLRPQASGFSTR